MPPSAIPNILSILTFLPLIGAVIVMMLPRPADLPDDHHHGDLTPGPSPTGRGEQLHGESAGGPSPSRRGVGREVAGMDDPARMMVNWTALGFAVATFLLSIALFVTFKSGYINNASGNAMQFLEDARWISFGKIDIHYRMGVDGISLLLLLLTTFLMVLCILFSFNTKTRLKEFMVFLLFLETGMLGVFCALDLVLFYFFWEAMLIPMYFLIGIFGHERRIYAAIKFFLFTFIGSILMLVAIVWVYNVAGTFDVLALSNHNQGAPGFELSRYNPQALMWMFGAFSLAFMIKVPMFPFHTWLPDAHVEAPTVGSVILAGVMLKMGTYGFIRFCLPIFPDQARDAAPLFIILAIIGIIYGSIVAAVQPDAKKLVAYSSVAHLGFVILGIFTFTRVGMMGALVQNINHGISTPMLFFLVGMLYERRHTRAISEFGGLKKIVPMFAAMLLIATLASVAVPFFNGFVGEFPILVGSWISTKSGQWPTALAATGMVLSAVYMLWWFQRLMLGPVTKEANRRLPDLSKLEWAVLIPLTIVIFWFGIGSAFWTERMDNSVSALLNHGREAVNDDLPISSLLREMDVKSSRTRPGEARPMRPVTPPVGLPMGGAPRALPPAGEGAPQ